MINGVSRSKGEGLGSLQKTFNLRFETLSKPTDPSSSSSAQRGLDSYFIPISQNANVLKQSEPKDDESRV